MSILVMKFGGTSVANLERINNLKNIIKKKIKNGQKKILLVVSAMSGVTNRLIKEYKGISPDISNPEYDSILATGEQYSSALISTLLDNEGIKTRSLLGWQVPIITDSNYRKARIEKI